MHNIFYDDNKNRFHVHAGYTDIKKDGYSSAGGDDAWLPMTEEETYAWNGEGVQSFYPSKTKDFDLNKTWELGSHTLSAAWHTGQILLTKRDTIWPITKITAVK